MIAPMNIPAGTNNICIQYLGDEYISYPCGASTGASFNQLGTDVTADISSIDYGQFTTDVIAVVDPISYIVDDAFNAYFKVSYYTTTGTTRPTRI